MSFLDFLLSKKVIDKKQYISICLEQLRSQKSLPEFVADRQIISEDEFFRWLQRQMSCNESAIESLKDVINNESRVNQIISDYRSSLPSIGNILQSHSSCTPEELKELYREFETNEEDFSVNSFQTTKKDKYKCIKPTKLKFNDPFLEEYVANLSLLEPHSVISCLKENFSDEVITDFYYACHGQKSLARSANLQLSEYVLNGLETLFLDVKNKKSTLSDESFDLIKRLLEHLFKISKEVINNKGESKIREDSGWYNEFINDIKELKGLLKGRVQEKEV